MSRDCSRVLTPEEIQATKDEIAKLNTSLVRRLYNFLADEGETKEIAGSLDLSEVSRSTTVFIYGAVTVPPRLDVQGDFRIAAFTPLPREFLHVGGDLQIRSWPMDGIEHMDWPQELHVDGEIWKGRRDPSSCKNKVMALYTAEGMLKPEYQGRTPSPDTGFQRE